MGSPERKPGEPFYMFKIRRKIQNRLDKLRLKGRTFYCSKEPYRKEKDK